MDKENSIKGLQELIKQLNQVDDLKGKLETALNDLEQAQKYCPHNLENYDENNKQKFIEDKIGPSPVKPKFSILIPVHIAKRKKYKKLNEEYLAQYTLAEKAYEIQYINIRTSLLKQDKVGRSNCIR